MEEVWKDIEGYEGLYKISNLGNVKSIYFNHTKNEKLLSPKLNNTGYLIVHLYKNGVGKFFQVHRIVATSFLNNPNNFTIVNHMDEDKQNNRVDNLEWCTHKYNVQYSVKLNKHRSRNSRKGKFGAYKHDKAVIQKNKHGSIVCTYKNVSSAARENGFNNWSIIQCCKRERKTAYGYRWEFVE